MAKVILPDSFTRFTGGVHEVDISAENYRELAQELAIRWPELTEILEKSAVAIDGQIYQDAFVEPLLPHSEVFFMPRIEGG